MRPPKKSNQSGQALVEYVLLLLIAATISISFNRTFSELLQNGVQRFNAVLESELRTGSLADSTELLKIWNN